MDLNVQKLKQYQDKFKDSPPWWVLQRRDANRIIARAVRRGIKLTDEVNENEVQ